ncbi:hypothetical protein LINPERHAP1_LOCUS23281 [Linum perenne]
MRNAVGNPLLAFTCNLGVCKYVSLDERSGERSGSGLVRRLSSNPNAG